MVAQFEFAARVRKRREELGLPAAAVSKHLGFTRNFYSAVENSRSLLATAKLPLLIEVLEFDDTAAQTLTTLLEQARTPGWWHPYASLLDDTFVQYLGLECGASKISAYDSLVFNGLLQSPDYALSVVRSSPSVSTIDSQKILESRLRRQSEVLGHGIELRFLLGEAPLWQQFGGPDVLQRQLSHVLELIERYGIEVRVQPFDATPLGLQSVAHLYLLGFETPTLSTIAYREAGLPIDLSLNNELVSLLEVHYELAFESSLDRQSSIDLLQTRVESLNR
ncbi:MAG: Scr1 family TA system antitoxin-like transcriptional regulator [Acidimicrobiales bacterium]